MFERICRYVLGFCGLLWYQFHWRSIWNRISFLFFFINSSSLSSILEILFYSIIFLPPLFFEIFSSLRSVFTLSFLSRNQTSCKNIHAQHSLPPDFFFSFFFNCLRSVCVNWAGIDVNFHVLFIHLFLVWSPLPLRPTAVLVLLSSCSFLNFLYLLGFSVVYLPMVRYISLSKYTHITCRLTSCFLVFPLPISVLVYTTLIKINAADIYHWHSCYSGKSRQKLWNLFLHLFTVVRVW